MDFSMLSDDTLLRSTEMDFADDGMLGMQPGFALEPLDSFSIFSGTSYSESPSVCLQSWFSQKDYSHIALSSSVDICRHLITSTHTEHAIEL